MIRYGVLGTGAIASRMVDHIRGSGNSDVSAVASSSAERAASFSREFHVKRAYCGYSYVCADPDVDAVYVALPNSLHFEFCRQALENGKHVLCEKPLVLQSRQIDALESLAKRNNLRIMECFWYRFHPLIDRMIVSLEREIGVPLGFYSTFSFENILESDIRWDPGLGGGALYDLMCYDVDALNYLFKRNLPELSFLEAFSRQRNGVEANIAVEALFGKKLQVILSSSIDRPSLNRTTIVGTEGTLVIPGLRVSPAVKEPCYWQINDAGMRQVRMRAANAYARMVEAFSGSILKNTPTPIALSESRGNLVLIEKIRSSLRTEMSDRVALYPRVKSRLGALLSSFKRAA